MRPLKTTSKMTRAEAYDCIINIRNHGATLESDSLEIDSLLNYFAPAVPKNPKTAIEWVAKAVSKDLARESLNHIYVETGVMYGCDGHRVHWADTTLDNGFYDAKTQLPISLYRTKYPDIKRVIDGQKRMDSVCRSEAFAPEDIKKPRIKKLFTDNSETGMKAFQAQYFNDALADIEGDIALSSTGMVGSNQFGQFIVMETKI